MLRAEVPGEAPEGTSFMIVQGRKAGWAGCLGNLGVRACFRAAAPWGMYARCHCGGGLSESPPPRGRHTPNTHTHTHTHHHHHHPITTTTTTLTTTTTAGPPPLTAVVWSGPKMDLRKLRVGVVPLRQQLSHGAAAEICSLGCNRPSTQQSTFPLAGLLLPGLASQGPYDLATD